MHIYLNGRMLPPQEAMLPVDDAGLQHAVGLFETMLANYGRVFRLEAHLNRLAASAIQLGLVRTLDTVALTQAVEQVIEHNKIDKARIRLTLTAGRLSMVPGREQPVEPMPTLLIVPSEPTRYDPAYFKQGITVLVAPPLANPLDAMAGHKTLNYWPRLRTLRQAASVGAGEAIWLNISNHLAGGAISNLFIVKDKTLFTPIARGEEVDGALPAPVLPGVTRAAVMELAKNAGLSVETRMLGIDDLLTADEVFLTNSSWLILPVTRVEKQPIAQGAVGDITIQLRDALLDLIQQETQSTQD